MDLDQVSRSCHNDNRLNPNDGGRRRTIALLRKGIRTKLNQCDSTLVYWQCGGQGFESPQLHQ